MEYGRYLLRYKNFPFRSHFKENLNTGGWISYRDSFKYNIESISSFKLINLPDEPIDNAFIDIDTGEGGIELWYENSEYNCCLHFPKDDIINDTSKFPETVIDVIPEDTCISGTKDQIIEYFNTHVKLLQFENNIPIINSANLNIEDNLQVKCKIASKKRIVEYNLYTDFFNGEYSCHDMDYPKYTDKIIVKNIPIGEEKGYITYLVTDSPQGSSGTGIKVERNDANSGYNCNIISFFIRDTYSEYDLETLAENTTIEQALQLVNNYLNTNKNQFISISSSVNASFEDIRSLISVYCYELEPCNAEQFPDLPVMN